MISSKICLRQQNCVCVYKQIKAGLNNILLLVQVAESKTFYFHWAREVVVPV